MRIAVSPAYRERHEDDLRILEVRCDDLDVFVSTYQHHDSSEWTVRVRRGSKMTKLRGEGSLLGVIAGALDDFEAEYGEPWTEAEILQVASQSPDIEVRRA